MSEPRKLDLRKPLVFPAADLELVERIIKPAAPYEKRGMVINEGFRFIAVGESGSGKTSLMRAVVYQSIARGFARFGFIHDTKGVLPEYPHSVILRNPAEFMARGGFRPGEIPVASFRGDVRRGVDVTAEEVAQLSLAFAQHGLPSSDGQFRVNPHITVIEELSEAATQGGQRIKAPTVLKLEKQGRKIGVSMVGTGQEPVEIPKTFIKQATAVSIGRLTGADANYMADVMQFDDAMIRAVRGPNGEGLPNYHFVLLVKGEAWDGQIHTLSKQTVDMFE